MSSTDPPVRAVPATPDPIDAVRRDPDELAASLGADLPPDWPPDFHDPRALRYSHRR